MVSFELGKEIVKDIFCLVTRGTKKKFSDLADRRVCGSMIKHRYRSAESEGLKFDSSWRLRVFSMSCARNKDENYNSLYTIVL